MALIPAAAAILGPIIAGTIGAQKVLDVGVEVLASLVGHGAQYPKCCCPDDKPETCAVVSSTKAAVSCPKGWSHNPGQCAVPEMLQYSSEQTMGGCKCKKWESCANNEPYHGHAWCHVEGESCGSTSYVSSGGNWDYCRIEGKPLQYSQGLSTSANDALASFVPNEYYRGNLLGPSNPLKLGTWTDSSRA